MKDVRILLLTLLSLLIIGTSLQAHRSCGDAHCSLSKPQDSAMKKVEHTLVDLTKVIPNLIVELPYATPDNFSKEAVYPADARAYLSKEAAEMLKAASDELNTLGYRIKVWDGYRPRSVQYKFWKLMPDEKYVANPEKGSRHNRGCAVDITLVDKNDNELDMGTEFDNFTDKAHRICKDFNEQVLNNRRLLENVMAKHGFEGLPTEWWHFDYKGWEKHPLLDVSFEELKKEAQ